MWILRKLLGPRDSTCLNTNEAMSLSSAHSGATHGLRTGTPRDIAL